jgi:branched-subunit amino acid aminotransferase/4-amino-4-deoxychorismate lyase
MPAASLKSPAWIWEPGGYQPCDSVPLSDRGFRYGMSVFESILLRAGQPVFLREHLSRLTQACARCGFKFDLRGLDSLENLLRGSVSDGLARIYVTAGDGGVSSPAEACRIFVFAEPRTPVATDVYGRGYNLALAKEPHQPVFGGLKTANYWANIAALNEARPKNESMLFNADGELISACMANVFVVQNGEIKTPELSCGARNGVVREWVMQRRKVVECTLTVGDLAEAVGVFLTSSWIGVMPVASVEGRPMPANADADSLRVDYDKAIRS